MENMILLYKKNHFQFEWCYFKDIKLNEKKNQKVLIENYIRQQFTDCHFPSALQSILLKFSSDFN